MIEGDLIKRNGFPRVYTVSKNKNQIISINPNGIIDFEDIAKKFTYKYYDGRLINPENIKNIKYSEKAEKILLLEKNRGFFNKLYLFDLKSKKIVNEFKLNGPIDNIIDVDISPNGQTFAILIKRINKLELQVMNLNNLKKQKVLTTNKDINKIKYIKDGNQIILGTKTGGIRLISADNGKLLKTFIGHKDKITAFDYDKTGNKLVSSSIDKTVKLWDLKKGILLNDIIGDNSTITSVSISPNGNYVLSGNDKGEISVWNIKKFKVNSLKKLDTNKKKVKKTKNDEVKKDLLIDSSTKRNYIAKGNIIIDKDNNLEWTRCTYGKKWNGKKCTGKAKRFNWSNANKVVTHGKNKWRVPTIKELQTLIYCSNGKRIDLEFNLGDSCKTKGSKKDTKYCDADCIDSSIFFEKLGFFYWSSNLSNKDKNRALGIMFYDGSTFTADINHKHHVRFVRTIK